MTEQELQSVINAVLSSIKTNSRSIGQLTGVQTLSDSDCFEVPGGRKIAYSVLRDLIFAAANTKLENIQTDIANSVLQSVSFDAKSRTATLTIKQKGYDAITVSVPIATDSQSGIMTAADKVKLDSTYSKQEIDARVDAIRYAIKKKQDKLVAGDDATRLNGAKLSTKQIFTGSIDTIAGAVPMLLPVGGCIYNSADKKLYIGDSNSQPVEVAKPNDFLFFSNGKLYHYQFGNFGEVETGTTLVAGDGATRINANSLSTKQIYKGTLISISDAAPTLPLGAYCFNTATKKLYVGAQHGNAMVTDTVDTPDDFLFVDTATGTTYRCDGTTLHNIDNIKTVNGQSLLGKGNVQLTGADMLLEQGAGLTINEAVNSNTEALQNKLDKDSIVQTTGQATDKVMSQKSVTDALDFPKLTLKVTFLTEVIKGKSVGGNGTLYNQAYHEVTCHIPCEGAHKVEIIIGAPSSSTLLLAAFYDADGKFLNTCTVYGGAKRTFTSPATSAYLVATYITDTDNERGVWIDGVKVHGSVPDDIEIKHEGGDKEYYLMSQKGVQDYVNQRLMDSAQSHSSFGSGFCYRLNARQIELLEASDVITLEICAQCNGGLNGYNNTAAMGYFGLMFGNNHGALTTSYDGKLSYSSDQKKYGQGNGYTYVVDGSVVTCWDRFIVVINRKTGVIRLYDKCSRLVAEKQREEYKSDSWLAGDDWLSITSRNVQDIWAIRIYDRDVEPMKYNGNIVVADNNFVEVILPYQHPSNAHEISLQDFSRVYNKSVYAYAPYSWPKTRAFDTDGYLTGTNDTKDWLSVGCFETNVHGYQSTDMLVVDFEVTGGNWRYHGRGHVVSCIKADGTDTGIAGYYEMNKTSAEMPAGRYTMRLFATFPWNFGQIAVGATVKIYSVKREAFHCVCNINPRYFCNGQCWDDARQEWWTPLDVNNHSTPVVPTFSDAAWRAVPAPSLLSQPSFNGQIKVDDSGKVYVGVVVGATRTWKQINNT